MKVRIPFLGIALTMILFFSISTINAQQVPFLSSPSDGGEITWTSDVTLYWYNTSGETLTYNVQVSTESDFSSTVYNATGVSSLNYTAASLSDDTYYWRVRSTTDGGSTYSSWSSEWSFDVNTGSGGGGGGGTPQTPFLSHPGDGTNVYSTSPTLYWYNTSGQELTYNLQVSTASDFSTTVYDVEDIDALNYALSGLSEGTVYYWRVRSTLDGGATYSDWSEEWSFTTPGTFHYTITASANNGTIDPEGSVSVDEGSDVTFTYEADENYHFVRVEIDGVANTDSTDSYTFFDVDDNHTIEVFYEIDTYTITATAGANGSISPSGSVTVDAGDDQVFTITPDAGYNIDELTVDGSVVASVFTYTFTNVLADHTIDVTFEVDNNFYVSTTGDDGGTGTLFDPFETIQHAIDVAGDPQTIVVLDGTYEENLVVNKPNITLLSMNGSDVTTIKVGTGVGIDVQAGGDGFSLGADGQGFTIVGTNTAAFTTTFLIQLTNAPENVTVAYNNIDMTGNASQGVSVGAAGATGLTVEYNSFTIEESEIGIWAPDVIDFVVNYNTFTGPGSSGVGIEPAGVTGTSSVNYNSFTGLGTGIWVLAGLGGGAGTTNSDGLVIEYNTFSECNNGLSIGHPSQAFDVENLVIQFNCFFDNTIGLKIYNTGSNLEGSFTVSDNKFVGNTNYGINNENTTTLLKLDATNNWWGSYDGPSGEGTGSGDAVSTEVIFDPFITPTISIEDVTTVTGATEFVDVTLSDNLGNSFNSLQGKFTYDNTKLDYKGYNTGAGTLFNSLGWSVFFSEDSANGEIEFLAAGFTPIDTTGLLFQLSMQVIEMADGFADIEGAPADFEADGENMFGIIETGTITYTYQNFVYTRGDVNLDGDIDIDDAIYLQGHISAGTVASLSVLAIENADADLSGGGEGAVAADITLNDVTAILQYVLTGSWPTSPSSPVGNIIFAGINVDGNNMMTFPITVVGSENIQNLELIMHYDESVIDYQTFVQMMTGSGNFVNASYISEGTVSFTYASTELQSGEFTPGSIVLHLPEGLPENMVITSEYRLNGGDLVEGPTYTNGVTEVEDNRQIPEDFEVSQNYPNPFNPTTTIKYGLPEASKVTVKIYNMLGQEVKTLINSYSEAGRYQVNWNGDNDYGQKVASGAYIYRIVAGENVSVKKMILLK